MHRVLVIGPNSQSTCDLITGQAFSDCVVEVSSGVLDTLRRLRQRWFDLVITDHQTSFAEDMDLFEEMGHTRPGLKVIILCPKTTPEEVIAALRSQVFGLFSVPCNADDLTAMVAVALETQRWREGIQVVSAHRDWIELRVECHLLTAERLVNFMNELAAEPDLARVQRDALVALGLSHPVAQRLARAADFRRDRIDRCRLRAVLALLVQRHPHRSIYCVLLPRPRGRIPARGIAACRRLESSG